MGANSSFSQSLTEPIGRLGRLLKLLSKSIFFRPRLRAAYLESKTGVGCVISREDLFECPDEKVIDVKANYS